MAWLRDMGSLYDFIGYVVLSAPDRFPREDYLQDHEQMTLDRAFNELRHGLDFVDADYPDREIRATLLPILDDAYSAYKAGDEVRGQGRKSVTRLFSSDLQGMSRTSAAGQERSFAGLMVKKGWRGNGAGLAQEKAGKAA